MFGLFELVELDMLSITSAFFIQLGLLVLFVFIQRQLRRVKVQSK